MGVSIPLRAYMHTHTHSSIGDADRDTATPRPIRQSYDEQESFAMLMMGDGRTREGRSGFNEKMKKAFFRTRHKTYQCKYRIKYAPCERVAL